MAKNHLANPIFSEEAAARQWFEAARWPNGSICPKCKGDKFYATKKLGRYRCAASTCRKDFTVMTGTVMERSHAKLTQWAAAFHMGASSKKGFSAHQLHRELGCQYNTAWFLHHRVMEAMRRGGLDLPPLGGEGKVVEVDETYYGKIPEARRPKFKASGRPFTKGPYKNIGDKRAIVSLVERGGKAVGKEFASHETVKHSDKEYARGDVTTNTVEGYFSIFKRGMRGVYQHCTEKHLHRYLAEFDFRYNTRKLTDMERTVAAVRSGEGKRLTYHQPH